MILYKYVCPERIDILKNRRIRFTQYFNQNDPYECSVALMPLNREKEEAEKDDYLAERAQLEVHLKYRFHQLGMLCLTGNPKNLLMWSHYADNHKGFVIGFDTKNSFFNSDEKLYDFIYGGYKYLQSDGFGRLKKIKYLTNRIRSKVGKDVSLNDLFFTKSIHWEYEEEYRIIKNIIDHEPIDKDEQIYILPFPEECITEIILGLNADNDLREKVISITNNDYKSDVKIMKAKLKFLEYELEFDKIKTTRKNGIK